jgi:hypothetical protein
MLSLTATTIYRIFRLRGLSPADAAAWTLWTLHHHDGDEVLS